MKDTAAFMQGFTLIRNQLDIDSLPINEASRRLDFASSLRYLYILISLVFVCEAYAGLDGAEIVSGQGVIVNSNLVRQDSARLAINAAGFGVKLGETFTLQQNLVTDIALIRVLGQNPSDILGSVNAKGQLFISNPNGVLFGKDAQVNVGGLLATTLPISTEDFMIDKFLFSGSGKSGSVVNQGRLTAAEQGYMALLAPEVRNEGVISASLGSVLLAAADSVTLNLNNGALFGYTIDKGSFNAMAENRQLIQADGGQVFMAAKAADASTTSVVNNSGTVRAQRVKNGGGVIRLLGDSVVTNSGKLDASANGDGGKVELAGRFVALGGSVDASGQVNGGQVNVQASENLSLASRVLATGASGNGGSVRYEAGGAIIENSSSFTDVSGSNGGSIFVNADRGVISSGSYRAVGNQGLGGRIDISGESVRLLSANIDASGYAQGGLVRLGGEFQGGQHNSAIASYDQFVERWQDAPSMNNTQRLFVNDSTHVNVSSAQGDGGTAIFWSDLETTRLGNVNASGARRGGVVEVSSAEMLRHAGLSGISGAETVLIDPKNITIGSAASISAWTYSAVLGSGYSGGKNVNVTGLGANDAGGAVALNAAGDRLALGVSGDDGFGDLFTNSGAVRLFSFSDGDFSGASLEATIGKGYVGGKNIDVASLESGDFFGASVAFNGAGDRLAVGAYGDDGAGNVTANSGAVRLFSFSDGNFTAGNLESIIGKGYSGAKDIDLSDLVLGDWFGSALALNATGDRLAIGAYGDNGASGSAFNSGAVRLFSFTDTNFSGGSLQAKIGKGYVGINNVDLSVLENNDGFGISLAFNAFGDRLAIGAYGDDGAGNLSTDSGAVYLFSFSDGNFSGGSLQAIVGKGYTGSKNVNIASLDAADAFGFAVAFNAAGDRLAVGAYGDDGAANIAADSGAAYLFGFSDANFNGSNLQTVFGNGYTGANDVNVTALESGDRFGSAVALNGTGNHLAVGANGDDGFGNLVTDAGAVFLFGKNTDTIVSGSSFADQQSDSVTFSNTELESILATGANVVLQANNDITVATAVIVNNAGGDGGKLTMQAGRNINFNANVTTDNGDLAAVAGDARAIVGERDAGTPTLTIANGVSINAGIGVVNLAAVGGNFVNSSGNATPINASRWYVYSTAPSLNTLGGMTPTGKHYNQSYVAGSTPLYATMGNWLLYSVAPVLNVTPDSQVINYGSSPAPFSGIYSGFIDGDSILTADISGTAIFSGGGASVGAYDINYINGLTSGLGYSFANNAASVGELIVKSLIPDDVINVVSTPPKTTDPTPAILKRSTQASCNAGAIVSSYTSRNLDRFIQNEDNTQALDKVEDDVDECDMFDAFNLNCPLW